MTEETIEKIAKALSDKNRIVILKGIARRGRIMCNEAQELTSLAQPTVSHHIKLLVESGLVLSEKEGRHVALSVNNECLKRLGLFFSGMA